MEVPSKPSPEWTRQIIANLGYTQEQASEVLGVSPRTVRKWVLGERQIPQPAARLLAYILNDRGKA